MYIYRMNWQIAKSDPIQARTQYQLLIKRHLSHGMINIKQNECTPSEDSDQHEYLPRLTRVFAVHSLITKDLHFFHVGRED